MTATKISQLPDLGTKSELALSQIGISTVEQLLQTDAYDIFARLKQLSPDTSLNMLYAIMGAQENTHWQNIARTSREEILLRLDDMGIAPK